MQISGTATELCPPPYLVALSSQNYSQNQLTKETYYDGAGSETDNITKTIAYTYDTAGNILSETKTVGTTTTTLNYTYGNTQWRDLLTKVGNTTISYDGGNPTNWYNGSKTYTGLTWQQGRQLAGLTVGETSVSYEYDADGIRTKMVAGDVTYEFVTQGGKLMRETATNSSAVYVMDFIYDNVGRPFAVKFSKNGGSSFTTFYYVLNLQGDVVAITKADGTVVAKYTYDAWGNLTSLINANGTEIVNRTTGTAIAFWNPLTYRGYIRDRETGFYYLQSRYYDPANHRFINADSYASTDSTDAISCNMFAYCGNNPVINADPSGELLITTLILIVAGVAAVGTATCTGYKAREAGCDWADTIFYAIGSGFCAFGTVYTIGMTAYGVYYNYCMLNGMTPVTEIGEKTQPAIPQEAYDTYNYVIDHNGAPPQVYKGGKTFLNDGRSGGEVLPTNSAPFREYDIFPYDPIIGRGAERIVIGVDSRAWYTGDHYSSFILMTK